MDALVPPSGTEATTDDDHRPYQRFLRTSHARKMMKLAHIGREDLSQNGLPILTGTMSFDDVDYTDYRFEIARLNSFVNWNVPFIDPEKLAAAGFYYIGKDDRVRCFECGTVLSGWVEGDDVMAEHQRWSGRCKFVRNIACGNVPIGVDPSAVPPVPKRINDTCGLYGIKYMPYSGPDNDLKIEEAMEHDRTEISDNSKVEVFWDSNSDDSFTAQLRDVVGSKQPTYASYERRLCSFTTWPEKMVQKKEDLAAAGFFYLDYLDQTMCFFCGGCLKDWDPTDDPVQEHIKWFPNCKFIQKVQKQLKKNPDLHTSVAQMDRGVRLTNQNITSVC